MTPMRANIVGHRRRHHDQGDRREYRREALRHPDEVDRLFVHGAAAAKGDGDKYAVDGPVARDPLRVISELAAFGSAFAVCKADDGTLSN